MKKTVLIFLSLICVLLVLSSCSLSGVPKFNLHENYTDIECISIKSENGKLNLELTATPASDDYTLFLYTSKTSDFKKLIFKQELDCKFENSSCSISIDYPKDLSLNDLFIKLFAVSNKKTIFRKTALAGGVFKAKNGLPQLTVNDVKAVVAEMTIDEKTHLVTGDPAAVADYYSGGTIAIERLGVPATIVNDGPAGVRYGNSTWHPSISNISSSWNNELIENVGINIGNEAISRGVDVVLAPGMNIQKNMLGGRNFEYSSEDPLLTGKLMSYYVKGIQKTGTGACIKHFAVNNQESSRNSVSSNVKERALREIYLKGFGIAVKESAPYTVMSSYNQVNGNHTGTIKELLRDILRDEFGFTGYVMSDWGANGSIQQKVSAWNDINMEGEPTDSSELQKALKRNKVSEEDLNSCCENILGVVAKISEGKQEQKTSFDPVKTAAETVVLLENKDKTLPLKSGSNVEIIGKTAKKTIYGGAGSGSVNSDKKVSFYEGLITSGLFNESENADYALVFIGRETSEGEDLKSSHGGFLLTEEELNEIKTASEKYHKKGGKVIVILNTGNPIEVMSWRDSVDAIIWTGYLGGGSGDALGAILSGEQSPSGKLTITWPRSLNDTPAGKYFPGTVYDAYYYEDIYVGYRYYETFNVPVAYEFGYGLTYSDFEYSDFKASLRNDGLIDLSVTVKNTGKTEAAEIVQFYVSKPETTYEQPSKELIAYGKTSVLRSGKKETISVSVSKNDFLTFDEAKGSWIFENGKYSFMVGSSVKNIKFEKELDIKDSFEIHVGNKIPVEKDFETISKSTYKVPTGDNVVNIAEGKPIKANYTENDDYCIENAVDGDIITRWSGYGCNESKHIVELDLEAEYCIDRLTVRWEAISTSFTVYYSNDGGNYTKLKSISFRDLNEDINFDGISARYIKLEIPKGSFLAIYELEVYEKSEK